MSDFILSFAAERPFFPYREPEAKEPAAKDASSKRRLRVYFISDGRMSGTLGSFPWHAKTVWADRVDGAFKARLPIGLTIPVGDFPENPWLTAFEDSASPRPGSAEVFFEESSDKGVVHPPDILVPGPPTVVPIELVVVPGLLLMWGGLRLRRAMKKS